MKAKKLFYLLACCVFLLGACKRDKLDGHKAQLVGRWQWSYTWVSAYDDSGGVTTIDTMYALDYNDIYIIEFEEKGIMAWYKNDKKIFHKNLVFDSEYCFDSGSGLWSECRYQINKEQFYFTVHQYMDDPPLLIMNSNYNDTFFPDFPIPEDEGYVSTFTKAD